MVGEATDDKTTHWAVKRVESRQRVQEAALRLFAEKGFEATTMEDIAEASGVSRRSLYRYFKTKEGVFFSRARTRLARFKALAGAPRSSETPYETVRRACMLLAGEFMADGEFVAAQRRIIERATGLAPLEMQLTREWDDVMFAILSRSGDDPDLCRALSGAIMGMVRAILRDWAEGEGKEDLVALGERAFEALEQGFGLPGK